MLISKINKGILFSCVANLWTATILHNVRRQYDKKSITRSTSYNPRFCVDRRQDIVTHHIFILLLLLFVIFFLRYEIQIQSVIFRYQVNSVEIGSIGLIQEIPIYQHALASQVYCIFIIYFERTAKTILT